MTEEPWNKHTPGDPMPCKCGESVVEVKSRDGAFSTGIAENWFWRKIKVYPYSEITDWRFIERKGDDVIAADPYTALEWNEDDTATAVLKKPGKPWWVRDDDLVRFHKDQPFERAVDWFQPWYFTIAFQIKRRPVPTPPYEQLLAVLAVATDDEADAIRQAARRANIEVPE